MIATSTEERAACYGFVYIYKPVGLFQTTEHLHVTQHFRSVSFPNMYAMILIWAYGSDGACVQRRLKAWDESAFIRLNLIRGPTGYTTLVYKSNF